MYFTDKEEMKRLLKRFTEPSTWAGISGVALAIAPAFPPPWLFLFNALAAGAGSLAIKLREAAPPQ